jgi:hypothetical protein
MYEPYSSSQSRPIFPEEGPQRYRTSILDLPDELLLVIFAEFTNHPETLRDIAKARQKFANAAKDMFLRTVRILVRGIDAEHVCNTLLAEIRGPAGASGSNSEARLPPLQHLEFDFSAASEFRLCSMLSDIVPLLPVLKEVTIRISDIARLTDSSTAVQDFTAMMKTLESRHGSRTHRVLPILMFLTECSPDGILLFAKSWPRTALQRLHMDVWAKLDIARHLRFAQHSLTNLTILESNWQTAQQPPVDFSGFSQVVGLRIPAGVWFAQAALGGLHAFMTQGFVWKMVGARPSVLRLLPPSIETLQVDFRNPG